MIDRTGPRVHRQSADSHRISPQRSAQTIPILTRRAVLAGAGAGVASLLAACFPNDGPATSTIGAALIDETGAADDDDEPMMITDVMLAAFDAEVGEAMRAFGMLGSAVAIVKDDKIIFNRGYGIRDTDSGAAVTPNTRFRIGSNTKSMTSLLIAKYVDQGLCTWDGPVIALWPGFVGPTPALTESLTLAQLLGMGSGIGEPETIEFFAAGGGVSAKELLETIPHLEVVAADGAKYFYNNTLVAAAPYLVMLAAGTAPADLEERYANDLESLVLRPIGMDDAVVAADPRPFGPDYAAGYTKDLAGTESRTPFVSIGGYGPAGSVLASSTDMARYLIAQARAGVAPDGTVVASEANVARTHQAGVVVPPNATNALPDLLLGDLAKMNYDLGWFDETFTDDRRLLWHAGGIDGFGSLMGFFPREAVGFVILTNLEPSLSGLFNFSVESSLFDLLFGLNGKIPGTLAGLAPQITQSKSALAAATRAVDPSAVAPYLGLYSDGFHLDMDGADLFLRHDIRRMSVRAIEGADYVIFDGPGAVAGKAAVLATDNTGAKSLTLKGFDPVIWLTGD